VLRLERVERALGVGDAALEIGGLALLLGEQRYALGMLPGGERGERGFGLGKGKTGDDCASPALPR
jgi:hypothetical protein